jgi:hypothetical protein
LGNAGLIVKGKDPGEGPPRRVGAISLIRAGLYVVPERAGFPGAKAARCLTIPELSSCDAVEANYTIGNGLIIILGAATGHRLDEGTQ